VFELTVRIVFSLLVVLALMWGLARMARRPLGMRRAGAVAVLGRQQLSKGASVAIVRVVDRALVLGVTDGQVTLLGEADLAAVEEYQPEPTVRREAVSLDELSGLRPTASVPAQPTGALAGSVLSAQTWAHAMRFLRERTVRTP
jgi:flagellar protein FliO/FliZ